MIRTTSVSVHSKKSYLALLGECVNTHTHTHTQEHTHTHSGSVIFVRDSAFTLITCKRTVGKSVRFVCVCVYVYSRLTDTHTHTHTIISYWEINGINLDVVHTVRTKINSNKNHKKIPSHHRSTRARQPRTPS